MIMMKSYNRLYIYYIVKPLYDAGIWLDALLEDAEDTFIMAHSSITLYYLFLLHENILNN